VRPSHTFKIGGVTPALADIVPESTTPKKAIEAIDQRADKHNHRPLLNFFKVAKHFILSPLLRI
jgi:hypothetical protein